MSGKVRPRSPPAQKATSPVPVRGAHLGIVTHRQKGIGQRAQHAGRQGVARLGPVDADQRDVRAVPIEVDGAAHAPTCGALAWSAMRQRSAKGAIMSFTVAAAAASPPQSKIT